MALAACVAACLALAACSQVRMSTHDDVRSSEWLEVTDPPISLLAYRLDAADPAGDTVRESTAGVQVAPDLEQRADELGDRPVGGGVPTHAPPITAKMEAGASSFRWLTSGDGNGAVQDENHAFLYLARGTSPPRGLSEADIFHPDIGEDIEEEVAANNMRLAGVASRVRRGPKGLLVVADNVDTACLKPELVKLLEAAQNHFGNPVLVFSGYRDPVHNHHVGGARNSMHLYCKAADIQIDGVSKWELAHFLSQQPGRGGIGTYCRTESVHVDIGPRRQWHHPCGRLADADN